MEFPSPDEHVCGSMKKKKKKNPPLPKIVDVDLAENEVEAQEESQAMEQDEADIHLETGNMNPHRIKSHSSARRRRSSTEWQMVGGLRMMTFCHMIWQINNSPCRSQLRL